MDRARMTDRRHYAAIPIAITVSLASGFSQVVAAASTESPVPSATPTALTVGLGYIPSVQFAQFYLAEEAGYYDEAGLDVTFQNKIDPELVTLLGQGAIDVGMADGTSLIPAVSQGIPVVYGATIYADFPNVVFSASDAGIDTVSDLADRSIGIPGRFGSSWVMLLALLASEGMTPEDVEVVTYPDFGQGVAVAEGQVDAATGFLNNEPVQLALSGMDVDVLRVDDVAPLPGPGLAVGVETLASKGDALRAFTAATLRAMEDIAADPQRGLDATFARVPELAEDPETQLAILEATIDAWMGDGPSSRAFGAVDPAAWQSGIDIMSALPDSVVSPTLSVEQLITDELLP